MAHTRRPRQCEICAAEYRPTYAGQRTCNRTCGLQLKRTVTLTQLAKPMPKPVQTELAITRCVQCEAMFLTDSTAQTLCSKKCKTSRNSSLVLAGYHDGRYRDSILKNAHLRRVRLLDLEDSEQVRLSVVAERDNWTCKLCGGAVPRRVDPCDRSTMASLDHVIPIARGGSHTYANVQLTHYRCNLSKGARV